MNARFTTKEIPIELMLAIIKLDPNKVNIVTVNKTKRPKRGYTVGKNQVKKG